MATQEDVDRAKALLDALTKPTKEEHLRERANGASTTRYTEMLAKQKKTLKDELKKAKSLLDAKTMPKDTEFKVVVKSGEHERAGRSVILVLSPNEVDRLRMALDVSERFYMAGCNKTTTPELVKNDNGEPLKSHLEQCCVEAGVQLPEC